MHPEVLLDIPALRQRSKMLLDTKCSPESAQIGGMLALEILIFLWNWQPQDGRGHSVKEEGPTFVGRAGWKTGKVLISELGRYLGLTIQ